MEAKPNLQDKNWEVMPFQNEKKPSRVLKAFPFPSYTVDRKLIQEISRYNHDTIKGDRFPESTFDESLAMLYVIRRKDKILHVGYTYRTLRQFMRMNLSRKLDKAPSIFDQVKGKYENLQFEGVEFMHNFSNQEIVKRVQNYDPSSINLDLYRKLYRQIIKDVDYKKKLPQMKIYLYVHQNTNNHKRLVSACIEEDSAEETLAYFLDQHEIETPIEEFTLLEHRKLRTPSLIEMYILMDELTLKHNSIRNGYNHSLKVVDDKLFDEGKIEDRLYLMVNQDLMRHNFTETKKYPEEWFAYIYQLQDPEKKSYIGIARNKKMSEVIQLLYQRSLKPKNSGELKNLLSAYPYYELKFRILKIVKKKEVDLKELQEKYIEKYDSRKNGYNDDRSAKVRQYFAIQNKMRKRGA